VSQHGVIAWLAIISSIGSELVDLVIDLIKQRLQLRGIAGLLICQAMSNNLATVGIYSQMKLSPAAPGLYAVLFFQPLAGAIDFELGAVDQNVNGAIRHMLPVVASGLWLPGFGPAAERGVIWHSQVQSHHVKHRAQKPFALAQTQSEYHAQHQSSFDRLIRIDRLATARFATWGRPARQCFRRYPKG
jgi:hypothetical protein